MGKSKEDFTHYQEEQFYEDQPFASLQLANSKNMAESIWDKAKRLSNYIDEKIFPVSHTSVHSNKALIIHSSGIVQDKIDTCKNLNDVYAAHDSLIDFKKVWGDDAQVLVLYDKLLLSIRSKEKEIMERHDKAKI